jgi:tRNA-binding protein
MPEISHAEFERVEIRVGTVRAAEINAAARKPAYVLTVDFGPVIGTKRSSAQIVPNYTAQRLIGRQVMAVVNFPPKQIGKMMSECLVLGFPDAAGNVVLAALERPVPDGGRLY